MSAFDFITFDQGIERIKKVLDNRGLGSVESKVFTSRDPDFREATQSLKVEKMPEGFTKWQLPFYFEGGPGSQFFLTVATPGAVVEEHTHEEGHGVRFITSGSIIYKNQELTAGDWMFIPQGAPYEFKVGEMGAVMCYCYQCTCIPR